MSDPKPGNIFDGPLARPFRTWMDYSEAAESLVHLTHEGLRQLLSTPELYRILEFEASRIERAEWKAEQARKEAEAGYPNLHAHSLLGLFGAFEAFVEDVFLSMLEADPSVLASEAFAKVRLPVALSIDPDPRRRAAAVLAETSRTANVDLTVGATRYESILDLVGLGGAIPKKIRTALYEGQQIRNVWAHRGGVADERFVNACPNLGYAVGARVDMDAAKFLPLMHATHMYGVVIANRYFIKTQRQAVCIECEGYEGTLSDVFQDMRIHVHPAVKTDEEEASPKTNPDETP